MTAGASRSRGTWVAVSHHQLLGRLGILVTKPALDSFSAESIEVCPNSGVTAAVVDWRFSADGALGRLVQKNLQFVELLQDWFMIDLLINESLPYILKDIFLPKHV